ncbi:MAG: hypothetical protein HYY30_07475 [Chloroflexi bacterium]|nr:hypothetical protein [Chloroflexota bacterium]
MSTIGISLMQGITAKINPPRTVAVRFPLGRVTGPPFDHRFQSKVLSDAFEALLEMKQPGTILKLDHKYPEGQRDKDCNEH